MSLEVYHPTRQPLSTNLCRERSQKCSHICVPSSQDITSTSCLCPHKYKKTADGSTCEPIVKKIEVLPEIKTDDKKPIDDSQTAEVIEVVKDEAENVFLAPILGIVAVIVLLAFLLVCIYLLS